MSRETTANLLLICLTKPLNERHKQRVILMVIAQPIASSRSGVESTRDLLSVVSN